MSCRRNCTCRQYTKFLWPLGQKFGEYPSTLARPFGPGPFPPDGAGPVNVLPFPRSLAGVGVFWALHPAVSLSTAGPAAAETLAREVHGATGRGLQQHSSPCVVDNLLLCGGSVLSDLRFKSTDVFPRIVVGTECEIEDVLVWYHHHLVSLGSKPATSKDLLYTPTLDLVSIKYN